MLAFGLALPRIRRHVARDLRRPGLPADKVVAAVIRVLDRTSVRVGNDEYARTNGSFGITTLENKHAIVDRHKVTLQFAGKSQRSHRIGLADRHVAPIVRRCQQLPGVDLFAYEDEAGVHDIKSSHINEYLKKASGEDFTAKDFRTWAGTNLALASLTACGPANSARAAKQNVVRALDEAAAVLGNTRAVCRKSYVLPELLEAYITGQLCPRDSTLRKLTGLRKLERRTMATLVALNGGTQS